MSRHRWSALRPKCSKKDPCPPDADPMSWTHTFDRTYEGAMFDTLTCKFCGFEVKAAPKS